MGRLLAVVLATMVIFSGTQINYAASANLTDLTSAYQKGELEYLQKSMDVKELPLSVFKFIGFEEPDAMKIKVEVDQAALAAIDPKLLDYKGLDLGVIKYKEGRNDYKLSTYNHILNEHKLSNLGKTIQSINAPEPNFGFDFMIVLINDQDQIIASSIGHLEGVTATPITENEIPLKSKINSIPLIDPSLISISQGQIPDEWKSFIKHGFDINLDKIIVHYPNVYGLSVQSANPRTNSEFIELLNQILTEDGSISEIRENVAYGTGVDSENGIIVLQLYDASKNAIAYNVIKHEGAKLTVLGHQLLFPSIRELTPNFSVKALSLSTNAKSGKSIMKINRSLLPKEMQGFTKFVLNSTGSSEFSGIDKTFTDSGKLKSIKYNYKDLVGFEIKPDGKRIFCLQLFNDQNQMLGYLMFK